MLRDAEIKARVFSTSDDTTELAAKWAAQEAALTVKGEPRRRRPPGDRALLERVAALYTEAVHTGSTTPSTDVYERLVESGLHTTPTQVRKWVQRARERGLDIPPARRRR
jgi:hypothetical protein